MEVATVVDGSLLKGKRYSVTGADGVPIGLLTSGVGDGLLLVHGGMSQIEAWEPVWDLLSERWQATAMDRRGRGVSGDAGAYVINQEYEDITAVASVMADQHGGPIDVFAHSYGATCTLGAAARGAAFRRVVLYEPLGPQTLPEEWLERASTMATHGRAGQAMFSFLTEIIGLSVEQVQELADQPRSYDVLAIVAATLPREGHALMATDLLKDAPAVTCPVLLLLGQNSPSWARDITHALAATLANAQVAVLPGQGHEAIDSAPDLVVNALERFLLSGLTTTSRADRCGGSPVRGRSNSDPGAYHAAGQRACFAMSGPLAPRSPGARFDKQASGAPWSDACFYETRARSLASAGSAYAPPPGRRGREAEVRGSQPQRRCRCGLIYVVGAAVVPQSAHWGKCRRRPYGWCVTKREARAIDHELLVLTGGTMIFADTNEGEGGGGDVQDDPFLQNAPRAVRQVTEPEAGRVTELFTLAFYDDPTWSWAFPTSDQRMDHHRIWWGLHMHSALRYRWVWMTDDGGAAALWIPPGEPELSVEDEERVEPLLRELIGSHADDVLTLLDSFDANHPRHEPHYYLSLLGTHPDHRGHGKGMGLLAANLADIDELRLPTYLESSNRANDHRYERLGFEQIGEFAAPAGGPTVAGMWRDPQ